MLDIALRELALGAAQQVLAHQRGLRMHQRHHVLQLVAETVGAARLVVTAASPQTAGQGLVQQPAIGQYVERRIGSRYLYRAERALPVVPYFLQRGARRAGLAQP